MQIHSLKTLMDKTLDDVSYLRDYGTISEELWDACYYLWYGKVYRHGDYHLPESLDTIQASLSPDNLLVFQEYSENFNKINT